MNTGSKENHQEALDHFRRAADLFTLLGDEINMMTAKKNISKVEAKLNGIEYDEGRSIILSFSQKQYNCWLKSLENITPSRLEEVSYYAHALYCLNQGVTAERLLTKLVAVQLLSTSAQLPPLERGWEKCPRFLTVFMAEKQTRSAVCVLDWSPATVAAPLPKEGRSLSEKSATFEQNFPQIFANSDLHSSTKKPPHHNLTTRPDHQPMCIRTIVD